ncbi:HAD-like domain-containing protein [Naematelia encephala]|uniref:HAD-like domain-containing protein n=1 Tax=Naematelia encephala TaxID=71784 RepID=A0A1Y2AJU1_9TREE|nr:HAD-like domain-containing protein [Naematelia encephala]
MLPGREISELAGFKALVFDCYGTLIDTVEGKLEYLRPIFMQKTCPDIAKVLDTFTITQRRLEAENKDMLLPDVMSSSYHESTGLLRLAYDEDAAEAYARSAGDWPAFPDTAEALARLKEAGLKLFVLSNVDNVSFEETRKKLEAEGGILDAAYTAEDIGSYKPDLRNFQYALEHIENDFDISPNEVLSVAHSKYHDVGPAHHIALKSVWISRPRPVPIPTPSRPEDDFRPDWQFDTVGDFADAILLAKAGDA